MHTISAKVLAWQYGSTKRVPDTTKLIWRYQVLEVDIHYPESCGHVLDILVTGQIGTMSCSSVKVLFSNVVLCKDGLLAPRIELQGTCFTFVILDAERRKLCFLCILFTREDRCYPVGKDMLLSFGSTSTRCLTTAEMLSSLQCFGMAFTYMSLAVFRA